MQAAPTAERTAEPITVDVLFSRAEGLWQRWRADHPKVEDESDQAFEARCEIASALVLSDEELKGIATDDRLWLFPLEMAPDTPAAAVRLALEDTIVRHLGRCPRSEPMTAAEASLDAILGAAVDAWQKWLREHPDVDLDSVEDEPNELIYEAQGKIADLLIPEDEELIQQLVCDPRIWRYRSASGAQGETIGHAAALMLEDVVKDHLDEIRRSCERPEPAVRSDAVPAPTSGA